jgi:hypothetical protein
MRAQGMRLRRDPAAAIKQVEAALSADAEPELPDLLYSQSEALAMMAALLRPPPWLPRDRSFKRWDEGCAAGSLANQCMHAK